MIQVDKPGAAILLRPSRERRARVDASFYNRQTGLGVAGRDRRMAARLGHGPRFTWMELENWYASDAIFAKTVDLLPDDMTRAWVDFTSDDGPEIARQLLKKLEALKAQDAYNWGHKLARMHGGAVVVLGVNDGRKLEEPLDRENIRAVNFLVALDRWQVWPDLNKLVSDLESPHFGQPEFYTINTNAAGFRINQRIHHTRIHRIDGVKLPERIARAKNMGWGDSIAVRLWNPIRNYHTAHDAASAIVDDFTQAIYKLKDLAADMETGDDETVDALTERLRRVDQERSLLRAITLDLDETFEKLSTNVTGLDKLVAATEHRLTAESNIPHTRLLGESPGGHLSQQGTSQERQWFDYVASQQETRLAPHLLDLVEILLLDKSGPTKGKVPANWSLPFKPLWQLDEVAAADVRLKQAQADDIYLNHQVLYGKEVATSRFKADGWSPETTLDEDLRAEIDRDLQEGLPDDAPPGDTPTPNPQEPPVDD